jgi:hypothetical protein
MDCSRARRVKRTARVVYSHEPEPEGNGILYGGEDVELGIEAEAERSIWSACIVFVVVCSDGERGRDEDGGNGRMSSADKN